MKRKTDRRGNGGALQLFVITGLSGAGKSQTLKTFEDIGFFCVDNLPVSLVGSFADYLLVAGEYRRVALGLDIRERDFLEGFSGVLRDLRSRGIECRILFLDSSDKVLVQRFSETRHRHPLGMNILDAIHKERRELTDIKAISDKVIDTSDLTLGELKEEIQFALDAKRVREMTLSVVSFGYKYGLPLDADLAFDVRFLPNPNYRPKLARKNGLDAPVQTYLLRQAITRRFLSQFTKLIKGLLPYYIREGKSYLTVAIGCTGGRHRSVFVTHTLAQALRKSGYRAREYHRDLNR
ncbi:MAG: RNase adaptor protein RapZ [Elusimicrobia bacterium GWA2_69_24]|nr:MAG: RNase adaptor protein RapZ [Elusimicrobia bacterium GWA2_69_24]HBL17684.1 RNase adapter RapZ [Elusimicrobiota bacterium]